ncbi:hypothetical protein RA178_06310 [Shewanella oncorhynchi]|uniref:Uncharacterized protein n=1 Tax=Shewanella oncorhynchi TaxID=2726434 RepID=A0AA50KFP7_9GAMM|nr:hypothetical protein [Shewanella oncorhynchi]WMB74225.1 hypothetical protein RA178_06310 [Shewanella oncorhynchi]
MITLKDTDYILSDVSVKQITPNFYTESVNYIGNSKSRGLHRLEMEFTVTLENSIDVKRFNAFMLKVRGRLNPFQLVLSPEEYYNPLYTPIKTCKLVNRVDIGNNTITLTGFSGVIPAGSMFQFPNDTKIYTVLDDVRSNSSVEIFPACRFTQPENGNLNFNPSPMLRLVEDSFKVKYEKATEYKLSTMEVI